MDIAGSAGAFLTIVGTIFIAELTDKDALLLLSLGTKMKPLVVFAAGAIAFTITSAIIVLFGSILVAYVPILWVKVAGGVIMLAYAVVEYLRGLRVEENLVKKEERLAKNLGRKELYAFVGIVATLILLDLAGDATELITIVFVAQFREALLVFAGAVVALVAASALETALGSRLARFLSAKNIRSLSIVVFLLIGSTIILSSGIVPV
ncbi:MAG: TMEM165/GDT1 family protein [Thaumarchaeota archaeon]|nr:TMEM165/GDT1 family protein [Nitrososphaerota archaeon]